MDRTEYSEVFCEAVDTIISARMSNLQYDVTKICTIIDDSLKRKGRYTVSDGAVKFEAYTNDKTLSKDDVVMVTIPNGDYNLQKLIVYRMEPDTIEAGSYTTPLGTMQIFTDDIISSNQVIYGEQKPELLANDSGSSSQVGPIYTIEAVGGNLNGYTRLGISADFQSLLNASNVASGIYGLKVSLITELAAAPGERDREGNYEFLFTSEDMIGNPYAFGAPFEQQKVFDISMVDNITRIEVYFYQDGNFKNGQGELIEWQQINSEIIGLQTSRIPNNLFVNNIKIFMGYDLNEENNLDNDLYISCKEATTYHYQNYSLDTGHGPTKHFELRWIRKFKDDELKLLSKTAMELEEQMLNEIAQLKVTDFATIKDYNDAVAAIKKRYSSIEENQKTGTLFQKMNLRLLNQLGFKIRWYRYNIDYHPATLTDEQQLDLKLAGRFWENIPADSNNPFKCSYEPRKSVQKEQIKIIAYKVDTVYESESVLIENDEYLKRWNEIQRDDFTSEEAYQKALEDLKHLYLKSYESITKYISNTLTLTNEVRVLDDATFNASASLSIYYEDGSEGNYFIYDTSGRIIQQGQGHGFQRRMYAMLDGQEITPELGKLDYIAWYLPLGEQAKSMLINTPDYYIQNGGTTVSNNNSLYNSVDYICVRRLADNDGNLNTYQSYSINDNWSNAYTNNTIRCEVSIDGKVHSVSDSMRFGKINSQSNTTLILEMNDNNNAIVVPCPSKFINNLSKKEQEKYAKEIAAAREAGLEYIEIPYTITAIPYDIKGNKLSAKLGTWKWSWKTPMTEVNGKPIIDLAVDEKDQNIIYLKPNIKDLNEIPAQGYYGILQANYIQINETILTAYLNVPLKLGFMKVGQISAEEFLLNKYYIYENGGYKLTSNYSVNAIYYLKQDYSHIEGASEISYTSGGSAQYYTDAYKIFTINSETGFYEENYDVSWDIINDVDLWLKNEDGSYKLDGNGNKIQSTMAVSYLPKFNRINRNNHWYNALIASSFYAEGYDRIAIICKDAKQNTLWIQPLLITSNTQNNSNVDGGNNSNMSSGGILGGSNNSLVTDGNSGTIMSTILGAGRKNEDNTFSGIMIGDVKDSEDTTVGGSFVAIGKLTKDEFNNGTYYERVNGKYARALLFDSNGYYYVLRAATGIYGLQNGQISFSLKDSGIATFGKAGRGQIIIDGNESSIQSASYESVGSGLKLDLDDGLLEIKDDNKLKFKLSPVSPYLIVSGTDEQTPMIHIGGAECYLQSEQRSTGGLGAKLDLVRGTFDIDGTGGKIILSGDKAQPFFEVKTDTNDTLIHMDTDGYYLQSSKFNADSNIKLTKDSYQLPVYQMKPYTRTILAEEDYVKNHFYILVDGEYILSSDEYDKTKEYYKGNDLNIAFAYDSSDENNLKLYTAVFNNTTKEYTRNILIDPWDIEHYQILVVPIGIREEPDPENNDKYTYHYYVDDVNAGIAAFVDRELQPVPMDQLPSGLRLDLNAGKIEGYNLKLIGTQILNNEISNKLIINTEDAITPVKVGPNFYINWDGSLYCTKIGYVSNSGEIPPDIYEDPTKPIFDLGGLTLYTDEAGQFNGNAATATAAASAEYAERAGVAEKLEDNFLNSWMNNWSNKKNYLTKSEASDIYLTISDASDKYLAINDASNIYLTINKARDTYAEKISLNDYVLTQTLADANYINQTSLDTILQNYVLKEDCDKMIEDLQAQIDELKAYHSTEIE